ncbi:MAG: isoleucine--tRNA ligase, partial [Sediminibacterium sp.]|nr:isoleucine--tRNA ligase [Sediminibacterium sp.]
IDSSIKIIDGNLVEITNEEEQKKLLHKGKIQDWHILAKFKGNQFENIQYHQLLPFEANKDISTNACKVLLGDFVTTEDGTGIVHIAPAFGADDYKIGQKNNIGIINLVDKEGKFIDGVGEFSGRYVKDYKNEANYKDVNIDICVKLKHENKAFKIEKYEHNYPHCWRTDKPILYYPLHAWFIKTTAKKDRLIELNKTINWKPNSTGEGRFGNWLENMVDWNLSRSRFWGTPLPIWRTEDEKEEICIGSVEQLTAEYEKAIKHGLNKNNKFNIKEGKLDIDLHKPFVDEIELVSPTGKKMNRVSDLIDVWFDSGAMPFAQWHYPFENKNDIDNGLKYPADFIAEGVDQTRGWFYTLHTIGVLLNDKIAYKNVMSNGLVLDKNGNKMSKRLGNVINPFETIEKYGADATRWYLITNASPWDNLKFDLSGIQEVQRKFFGTFYNTYQFFAMYANVDSFYYSDNIIPVNNRPEIDRWIISVLNSLIKKVTEFMDDYEPTNAFRLLEFFLNEQLSNWYVRLNRRRFWKGEFEFDKICAYQTLYECLITISKLIAPISPFFSDEIYRNLQKNNPNLNQSVHSANYPTLENNLIDITLEEKMKLAQEICSIGLSLRKKENIKVRQPLQRILIPI